MDAAFRAVCARFSIERLKDEQRSCIEALYRGNDVFGSFPTGFGKSLIFQGLPTFFEAMRRSISPVVIVVSPLKALIHDQIVTLRSLGIYAAEIGTSQADDEKIVRGTCPLVYGSPEKFLQKDEWRSFLQLPSVQSQVIAVVADEAHTVLEWGESTAREEAFRPWCASVGEIRALLGRVPMLALTATVTCLSRAKLIRLCGMENCREIIRSPDRSNVRIFVRKIGNDIAEVFNPLVTQLKEKRISCPRVVIYCKSVDQCANLFSYFQARLRDDGYWPPEAMQLVKNRLFAMFHSTSAEVTKADVLDSLQTPAGVVRVVFATTALGLGVDIKGLHDVVHLGPPKTVEEYLQELGRAGRDGHASASILLWNGNLCRNISDGMRRFLLNQSFQCQRQLLLDHFVVERSVVTGTYKCCDVCEEALGTEHPTYDGITFVNTAKSTVAPVSDSLWSASKKRLLRTELTHFQYEDGQDETGEVALHFLPRHTVDNLVDIAHNITHTDDLALHANAPIAACTDDLLDIFLSVQRTH